MIKKWTLNISHRPRLDDDIPARHMRFLKRQKGIGSPWEIPSGLTLTPKLEVEDVVSVVQLGKVLPDKLNGYVAYSVRNENYLQDQAATDDKIVINFYLKNVVFETLVLDVFSKLVSAFDAYRAEIYGTNLCISEFLEIGKLSRETGRDIDGRDSVFRIQPVVFYDRELCKRSFGLSPEEVVSRLKEHVEKTYVHEDGVIIIYSSKPVDESTYMSIDGELRRLLVADN